MPNSQLVHILLAEDSETDAEMTMRALRKINLKNEIVWVRDGQAALDYVFHEGEFVDRPKRVPKLILLDLKMPKVDGIEVLQKLKSTASTRQIPVVMLTSSAEEQDIVRSYELGVNSYLVKPVEFDRFVEEVSKVGCYWGILNKIPSNI
ncbi:response regulator [Methyloradius palustris]|uniref:Response regulator n=1 Tax=Methyloradius palustris TaxID=2778876 RepID=A0A8D5JQQ5_9PROT|nr:response regulator [Methyloradius palustris]BCM24701.1 response regulator [Methyloradius palustris]